MLPHSPTPKIQTYFLVLFSLALVLAPAARAATVNCSGVAAWSANSVAYSVGQLVTYNGSENKCVQAHTSQAGWDPVDVPALWSLVGTCTAGVTPTPAPTPTITPTPTSTPTPKSTPTPTPATQPWQQYNLAPASRTVSPVAVYATSGSIANPSNVLSGQPTTISGSGSYIILDFGKEVGGYTSLTFSGSSDANQSVGLTFSESSLYATGGDGSNGNAFGPSDGALTASVSGASTYTVQSPYLRGGFRYLAISLTSGGWVNLSRVSLNYSPDPNRATPNQYPNYFYSNDATLNSIWYAGAYTFQTNILSENEGRTWPPATSLWNNSATIGEYGNEVLSDGAKRDRTIWPGDMGISAATGYVALDDTVAVRNSLQTLYNHQKSTGELPYSGPPMNFYSSDTYHM